MKVLVTGANGLLATNCIQLLLQEAYSVNGMIRDKSSFLLPPHPKLQLIKGDLRDPQALEEAVEGCEVVVHIAALTSPDLLSYEPYYKVNVEATEDLANAAIKHKVKRFIYLSSANTRGHGTKEDPGTEQLPVKKPFSKSWYAQSKLQAEQALLKKKELLDIVIINPSFMLGPWDAKPSSGRIILMGYKKSIVFHPPGGKNFVKVKDVARGILAVIENGRNGEAYLMASENMSYREFFRSLSELTGNKTLLIELPKPLLLAAGYTGDLFRRLGMKTAISSVNMKILCVKNYYSGKKAEQELGIEFCPVSEGIKEAVDWFKLYDKIQP